MGYKAKVQMRILWAKLKVRVRRIRIISCQVSVNGKNEEISEEFWNEVYVLNSRQPGERISLVSDENGWMGVERDAVGKIVM